MYNSFISCNIKPFMFKQKVQIFKDGKVITQKEIPLNNLDEYIFYYCKQSEIHDVFLSGSKAYANKIKEKVATNYEENDIQIYLV